MSDYARIARIIEYLVEHQGTQPSLDELAAVAGLSASHFHRLFRRWAGVTPKDFLQCMTLQYARSCLQEGDTVQDAALTAGLSGPARLHDLCVTLEAATPGEIRRRGAGLTLHYGEADTPFGRCVIASSRRGISQLQFPDSEVDPRSPLADAWPAAILERDDAQAARLAAQIFRRTKGERLQAWVQGTPFQIAVWRALLAIPEGSLSSYGRMARALGKPGASRAVGSAVGANPLAVLIPCHRVIRETGALGGYRWNPVRKRALIAHEGAARSSLVTPRSA